MKDIYGDYHTHTYYSDGVSSCRQNTEQAIKIGLKELAITDHGYNNPSRFALTREKYAKQRKEIDALRSEFGDKIVLYHGIEADIIGVDGTIDLEEDDFSYLDIVIMGYHSFAKAKSFYDWRKIFLPCYLRPIKYPSKDVIARNTKALIASIKKYPIDILSHINHLFKVDCYEVAKAAGDYGTLIEFNQKHFDFTHDVFEKMLTTSCEFIINSDAHHFRRIGVFPSISEFLGEHSFDKSRIVNLAQKPVFKRQK
ncbi:MAG: PHP domain-containing protein [Clostridia bacterium]